MRTHLWALIGTTVLITTTLQLSPSAPSGAAGAAVVPSLGVSEGALMHPAFSPGVSRYGVHPAPDGSVGVEVTGASAVWFDGVPDPDGKAVFTGLTAGEEISVFVDSASGRRQYALYVLPDGFPDLAGTVTGAVAPGHVALTLDRFDGSQSPRFEAIIDRQGVPAYTRRFTDDSPSDLKQSPRGTLTVNRRSTTPGRTGTALVELGDQLQEVARHETVGRVNTDNHDSKLMPDGSVWLVGYEPDAVTGRLDSVIQHVSADGQVLFDWSTAPYVDESTSVATSNNPDNRDYAHINSIDIQPNGDVVASFRHFSSVWRIAGADRLGTAKYDVVWRLGGRHSSFSFAPGEGGPCAQHTATVLPSGNVLMFDNGGNTLFGALCVDQDDPEGPLVERSTTRGVEWAIDEVAGTAAVAALYGTADRFSGFAGGAFKLPNGNVLIAWSPSRQTIANEVSADNTPVWELVDQAPLAERYTTYRAHLVTVPDQIDPVVTIDGPADGTAVVQGSSVPVSFACTDRGGSTLQSCDGPQGRQLDTSTVGTHTWTVTARDGDGRTTLRSRSYVVNAPPTTTPPTSSPTPSSDPVPSPQPTGTPAPLPASPDVSLHRSGKPTVGAGLLYPANQSAGVRVRPGRVVEASVRVRNVGEIRGRLLVRARSSLHSMDLEVTYTRRGVARTRALTGSGWRTPVLSPGESLRLQVRVRALGSADPGRGTVRVIGTSATDQDRVKLLVRVLRARSARVT